MPLIEYGLCRSIYVGNLVFRIVIVPEKFVTLEAGQEFALGELLASKAVHDRFQQHNLVFEPRLLARRFGL